MGPGQRFYHTSQLEQPQCPRVNVQSTSDQGRSRNTHHLPSMSVASAYISSLATQTDRWTQSLSSEKSLLQGLSTQCPPTNHIVYPVHVFAQSNVDPRPSRAATADPPAHQPRQLVPVSNIAGQRTSRVSLHIRLKVSVLLPKC